MCDQDCTIEPEEAEDRSRVEVPREFLNALRDRVSELEQERDVIDRFLRRLLLGGNVILNED